MFYIITPSIMTVIVCTQRVFDCFVLDNQPGWIHSWKINHDYFVQKPTIKVSVVGTREPS